jgi:hypothetical protein
MPHAGCRVIHTSGYPPFLYLRHSQRMLEHQHGGVQEFVVTKGVCREGPCPDGVGNDFVTLWRNYDIAEACLVRMH